MKSGLKNGLPVTFLCSKSVSDSSESGPKVKGLIIFLFWAKFRSNTLITSSQCDALHGHMVKKRVDYFKKVGLL